MSGSLGDHTNFNVGAFSTGAFCAAGALSTALGAGITTLLSSQPEDWSGLTAEQLLATLVMSERRRADEMQQWQATVDQLAESLVEIRRLKRDNAVLQAKAKLAA